MIRNIMQLFEILSLIYGLASVYGEKIKYNVYDALMILMEMILFSAINEKAIPDYSISLSYLVVGVYCVLRYDASMKKAIVNIVMVVSVMAVVQALCYVFVYHIIVFDARRELFRETISSVVCFVFFLVIIPKIKLKAVSDLLLKQNKLLYMGIGFVVFILGAKIWKIKKVGTIYARDYIPIIYFIVLVFVLVFEWQKAKYETEKKRAQLELNTLYYDAYAELIQSIREKQHDFKNHLNAISGMLYLSDDNEEIINRQKLYFEEILGEVEDVSLLTLIENPLLSGFLARKIREAEKNGIEIVQKCAFKSQSLKIPEYQLVEIMGILIDNAIDATLQLEGKKVIWIQMWQENDMFCFSVMNHYTGEQLSANVFEMGKSSKGRERGVGLYKLRRICVECGGEISMRHGIQEESQTIKFEVHIPI